MTITERYESAREIYAKMGIDTDKALELLASTPISMHCWQGDDVIGFEGGGLSGGIQATGNYPGRARTPEELMSDIDKALSLIPGKHRINLHASYAIFEEGEQADRDKIEPKHFKKWVEFAKERGLGLDFNPTCFGHPMADTNLTLSSPDETIRRFWIDHCKACVRISEYFATELGTPCLMDIWVPDGFKDVPGNRLAPRARLKESLDEIISMDYDKSKVLISVESKVFGIGVESCTVGSHEFYMNYAAKNNLLCLLDNGHYHPTEVVYDKISSMLLFYDKLALHVTRSVRWDSDHVVTFTDDLQEMAKEIVRNDALDRVIIGLDYFDASINRVAAWVTGMRNMEKALLVALLQPNKKMAELQDAGNFTELMVLQEEMKFYPFADVWNYYCEKSGVPVQENWLAEIKEYEKDVLSKR